MNTLHLIDASLYIFRAWHSMPNEFHDSDGAPVNAVHGFTRFLCDFLERTQPSHALAAFDESLVSSFRNAIYPAYKANRELPPPELKVQFDYCKQVAAALGLRVLADAQFEADDLIGSAVTMSRKQNFRAVIVSADKDFGQLIGRDDEQWDFSRNERWDAHGVKQRLGVRPDQVVDYLALTGDAVDNIPACRASAPKPRPACSAISARSMRCCCASRKCLTCVCAVPRRFTRGSKPIAIRRCSRNAWPRSCSMRRCPITSTHCAGAIPIAQRSTRCSIACASAR
jgi:hypothetical protein